MEKLLEITFQSFWNFIGVCIILGGISTFLYDIFNRLMRTFTLHKHGYPPEHCDADGEFRNEDEDEE